MIISTSSTDRAALAASFSAPGEPAPRPAAPRVDQVTTLSATLMQAALRSQPEIRPEIVARAREIASDPDYPPTAVIRMIAEQILAAPDLSEDQS